MIYLETGSTDPAYNLAFEEYVLEHRTEGDVLMLWQNDNAVIIGQNQNTLEEINEDFVREHGIRVVRRSTGGGAVYHDLGNLNYSFMTDHHEDADVPIRQFTDAVVDALRSLGLAAEASGRNDILVDGKKVSGTAQRILKGRILYHGTFLFDSDPEMIEGALHADPAKFESKSTKSVRSRVGCIRESLKNGPHRDITLKVFWDLIRERLEKGYPEGTDASVSLTEEELDGVRELKSAKYDTWEWNYGRSPKFSFCRRARFPGGSLEVRLNVEKGLIRDLFLYGDFLSLIPSRELADSLKGMPYRKENVEDALPDDLSRYLGSIRKEELLSVMFAESR